MFSFIGAWNSCRESCVVTMLQQLHHLAKRTSRLGAPSLWFVFSLMFGIWPTELAKVNLFFHCENIIYYRDPFDKAAPIVSLFCVVKQILGRSARHGQCTGDHFGDWPPITNYRSKKREMIRRFGKDVGVNSWNAREISKVNRRITCYPQQSIPPKQFEMQPQLEEAVCYCKHSSLERLRVSCETIGVVTVAWKHSQWPVLRSLHTSCRCFAVQSEYIARSQLGRVNCKRKFSCFGGWGKGQFLITVTIRQISQVARHMLRALHLQMPGSKTSCIPQLAKVEKRAALSCCVPWLQLSQHNVAKIPSKNGRNLWSL
eukprot:880387-Amphidinium_carterae.1